MILCARRGIRPSADVRIGPARLPTGQRGDPDRNGGKVDGTLAPSRRATRAQGSRLAVDCGGVARAPARTSSAARGGSGAGSAARQGGTPSTPFVATTEDTPASARADVGSGRFRRGLRCRGRDSNRAPPEATPAFRRSAGLAAVGTEWRRVALLASRAGFGPSRCAPVRVVTRWCAFGLHSGCRWARRERRSVFSVTNNDWPGEPDRGLEVPSGRRRDRRGRSGGDRQELATKNRVGHRSAPPSNAAASPSQPHLHEPVARDSAERRVVRTVGLDEELHVEARPRPREEPVRDEA